MTRPLSSPDCARAIGLVLLLAGTACTSGLGQLQTARTVPKGEVRHSISGGYDWNSIERSGPPWLGNFIVQYAARIGAAEHVDVGVKVFLGLGGLVDAKVQVVDGPRLALSLLGGAGGAFDAESGAGVVHVPAMLLGSYHVTGWFAPYVGAGYGAFWIFNYASTQDVPPGSTAAPRAWHGDGLLMLHAGFELGSPGRPAFLLEYGYLRPIVSDPGDHYAFATNHLFLGGIRF
jgi:hypothetical protein